MKNTGWIKFFVSLAIPLCAGWVGSVFTISAISSWYSNLAKSSLNPPSWVFGPVWTLLYLLMGISLFIVWKKGWKVQNDFLSTSKKAWNPWSAKFWNGDWQKGNIIAIFWIQLVLNVVWSVIFFGLHQVGLAFFELLALWFSILYLIINFYRVSKTAAWLLLPYILWVSFAAYLNWAVWMMN